jgi:hypothetical protein
MHPSHLTNFNRREVAGRIRVRPSTTLSALVLASFAQLRHAHREVGERLRGAVDGALATGRGLIFSGARKWKVIRVIRVRPS